jgi:hypothetical protein
VRIYSVAGNAGHRKRRCDQVLAIVNGENITTGDVEDSLKSLILEVQEQVYKLRKNELDLTINLYLWIKNCGLSRFAS